MKKLLILSIIFCFLINGLIPVLSIDADTASQISSALKDQSKVLNPFTLATVPVDIVHNLFMQNNPLIGSLSNEKRAPNKDKNHAKKTSSSALLTNLGSISSSISGNTGSSSQGNTSYSSCVADAAALLAAINLLYLSSGAVYLYLILALFFILLPRGTINDSIIIINNTAV